MHYPDLFILAIFVLGGIILRKNIVSLFRSSLRDYVSSVEDHWTWTTSDGRSYENVEVEKIEGAEVVFHHRLGKSSLMIPTLTETSLQQLSRTSLWQEREASSSG